MADAAVSGIDLARARRWVDEAGQVVVLTGAGISTDSGIPDFRGPNGVWTRNPAAEKAATIETYVSDPEVRRAAWRGRVDHAGVAPEPNAGHRAILSLERRGKLHTVITQNVDGLHQRAGTDPEKVVEVHGNVTKVVCLSCGERAPMEAALERVRAGEEDPPCRSCGGMLKSDTISFGQALVEDDLRRAERAAIHADVLLAVGSTLTVYPVADVPRVAKTVGARVVVINNAETGFDTAADLVLRGPISEILPAII